MAKIYFKIRISNREAFPVLLVQFFLGGGDLSSVGDGDDSSAIREKWKEMRISNVVIFKDL